MMINELQLCTHNNIIIKVTDIKYKLKLIIST